METLLVLSGAVLTASLLGSMHCVGMCGPLALWAAGAAEGDQGRSSTWVAMSLYHLGRLLTYALAGCVAGLIGQLVDWGGGTIGVQVMAARVVGFAMVVIGLGKLWGIWQARRQVKELKPSLVGKVLVKLRPFVFSLPVSGRALATGLLTTLLPCGWLYLFALIASGTGSPVHGAIVMAAFWLGSVPALVGLVAGVKLLSKTSTRWVPSLAATLLIFAGCFTATGRGFAGFDSLQSLRSKGTMLEQVEQAGETTLPCCQAE
ncbi:MAG: sulfite exporter TauE/SafE family protein [Planctomycetota bacterium]